MTDEQRPWFRDARFGMFIHWSHIARRGWEMSWPLVGGFGDLIAGGEATVDDYYDGALDFAPAPGAAATWARLARRAGMRYAVFTAKHHDGFAMWPSERSAFTIRESAYTGDDLVAEYVEAFRAEGIRVGLYFSLSDWHHPDYPAFADADRPYLKYLGRRSDASAWQRYLDDLFGQIEELLTRYGPIDLLWFDGQWERSTGEWKVAELAARIRELQPAVVINDRLPGHGDYATPEQGVPGEAPEGWWETCMTMNGSWGWVPDDGRYLSARAIVHTLCEVAGKGGNLLLNVSPGPDGALPDEQVARLDAVATWMGSHEEAIVGTRPGLAPWQFYGPTTRSGDTVYLHLLMRPYDTVTLRGVPVKRVEEVTVVGTGSKLTWTDRATVSERMLHDPHGEVVIEVPEADVDDLATVLAVRISAAR